MLDTILSIFKSIYAFLDGINPWFFVAFWAFVIWDSGRNWSKSRREKYWTCVAAFFFVMYLLRALKVLP